MKNLPALRDTLADIRAAAASFQDDWHVLGSAAAHLAGAETGPVADIDLLLSARDAGALAELWADCRQPTPPPSAQFRSDPFYRFQRALPVEAMANFEMLVDGRWRAVAFATRMPVDGLFIPSPAEQIAVLQQMGREKDQPRIAALAALG